jgi:hypothetical protein
MYSEIVPWEFTKGLAYQGCTQHILVNGCFWMEDIMQSVDYICSASAYFLLLMYRIGSRSG